MLNRAQAWLKEVGQDTVRLDSGTFENFSFKLHCCRRWLFFIRGPAVIKVEGGSDVVLPCSLSTKENIEFKLFFDWRKVAQKDDGLKEVFMYDAGIHYNNGLDGQSEEFKGRVSHFQDELKHGNTSIIIRNTQISDSGVYTCDFPRLQPPQTFPIELVVGAASKPSVTLQELTTFWALLQCEVHGNPKPKVELQDSAGNTLPAEKPQTSERGGSYYITLQTTVTKTGTYRCVATQEKIKHEIYAETSVYISGFSTLLIVVLVLGIVFLLVAGVLAVLAVLVYKGYIILNRNKGNTKDIRSKLFFWLKLPQKTDGVQNVFLYDKGDLYSDERPGQSEQFKGRISYFTDKLKQGNASITIRNTTWADSGVYRCIIYRDLQKPQKIYINLVVEPKDITVREGSDVTLPCSLWPKEDLRLTKFIWKNVSQKPYDDLEVFLYDNGERPDQSEQFQGRVSHFPDELEQGNASIIIRNMTWDDRGVYRCSFPSIQRPQTFYIKLDVEPKLITVEEGSDVTLPCHLSPNEDIRATQFNWKKPRDDQVFLYDNGDLYSDERPGQSEKFKGRVSHFPDELEQGNASIIIRNTTRADSGVYRCSFPLIHKHKQFHIKLVVGSTPEPNELHPLMIEEMHC
ncbi:uncharacterized protein LOC120557122 [Perca fluviatilis]|uniref:uncharacterized protein LOC120557122 n=1 Tax=Perca fluviatilis TaxID=8168 RepID=UPI0019664319|nr:uncharacterized protein LOC120557122 [Perca fluviatilis]